MSPLSSSRQVSLAYSFIIFTLFIKLCFTKFWLVIDILILMLLGGCHGGVSLGPFPHVHFLQGLLINFKSRG